MACDRLGDSTGVSYSCAEGMIMGSYIGLFLRGTAMSIKLACVLNCGGGMITAAGCMQDHELIYQMYRLGATACKCTVNLGILHVCTCYAD